MNRGYELATVATLPFVTGHRADLLSELIEVTKGNQAKVGLTVSRSRTAWTRLEQTMSKT
jgi:hypothetical protein